MSVERPLRSLIIDDDAGGTDRLRALLERWGHDVRVAGDARTAEVLARVWRPDIVLLELVLPDADGVTLIPRLRAGDEPPQVVIVSSHATVRVTVDALAAGAASVLEKPVDEELLQDVLARLSGRRAAADAAVTEVAELGGMVTRDPRMRALFDTMRLAAPSGVNILVQGENGTGKELVAAALHELSPRAAGPFVKVNCAAIPAGLLESELFGHERGAFTGAVAGRKGLFEQSNRGSILLDEIAEMPLPLQAKLLRVLQEREIRPVGGTTPVKADFRLICATNVDVTQAVADGRLRRDLYFRLNTIALLVPPLRERTGDVALLASRFLRRFAGAYGRPVERFTDHALQVLDELRLAGQRAGAGARRRARRDPGCRHAHRCLRSAADLAPAAGPDDGGGVRARGLFAGRGGAARHPADTRADRLEQASGRENPRDPSADALQQAAQVPLVASRGSLPPGPARVGGVAAWHRGPPRASGS